MNRKHEQQKLDMDAGEYTVRRSRLSLFVAIVACLLLSVAVWLFVMNTDSTACVALELMGGTEGFEYTLSDAELEVGGTVHFLKKAEVIRVIVSEEMNSPGTYTVSLANLVLPEGVALTEIPNLTLTVTSK